MVGQPVLKAFDAINVLTLAGVGYHLHSALKPSYVADRAMCVELAGLDGKLHLRRVPTPKFSEPFWTGDPGDERERSAELVEVIGFFVD
jgi:hypothetical protein